MNNLRTLEEINLDSLNHYKNEDNRKWRLNYHFEAPFGLINDPNGLAYYNGEYNLFFQWNPYGCEHKYKHWGLTKTKDFINYTVPKAVLAPNDYFDKNGCYSGSGIVIDNKLELLYTGNVKDENNNRLSYQCRAICNKDGNIKKLEPALSELPIGYTAHFRDPKIFKKDDKYYFVIGAQTNELKGKALLYSSIDLDNWNLEGEIKTLYDNFGFMWECPSLFDMCGKDILVFSPQGLEHEEFKYQNIYESGYIVGNLNYNSLEFIHSNFKELDMGFDFYAPQIFRDDKGRTLMIGWMGLPEEENQHPTAELGWIHSLTMVRELTIKEDIIYQMPVEEMKKLREEFLEKNSNVKTKLWKAKNIESNSYELEIDLDMLQALDLELKFVLGINEYTSLKYEHSNSTWVLDRSNMNQGGKGIRKFKLSIKKNIKLRMFVDKSAVEIYLQDGEVVLSSRLYPNEESTGLEISSSSAEFKINDLKLWKLGGYKYHE